MKNYKIKSLQEVHINPILFRNMNELCKTINQYRENSYLTLTYSNRKGNYLTNFNLFDLDKWREQFFKDNYLKSFDIFLKEASFITNHKLIELSQYTQEYKLEPATLETMLNSIYDSANVFKTVTRLTKRQ